MLINYVYVRLNIILTRQIIRQNKTVRSYIDYDVVVSNQWRSQRGARVRAPSLKLGE